MTQSGHSARGLWPHICSQSELVEYGFIKARLLLRQLDSEPWRIGKPPTSVSFSLSKSLYVIILEGLRFMTNDVAIRRSMRLLDLGVIVALICVSLIAILRIGLVPNNPTAGVAVVYAPWTPANETMVRAVEAGARFVRFGGFQFIAVVMPERPDYVDRVMKDSAWLAVDPQALAACLGASTFAKSNVQ
jgi:hypothetical protein